MRILEREININIPDERFFRRLGYPSDYDPPMHVEELMDWSRTWSKENGNPWVGFTELDVRIEKDELFFNNLPIDSPKLLKRYKKHQVQKAILIASTAGDKADTKCKQLWADDITDQSFFLDAYTASFAEALIAHAAQAIKEWASKKGLQTLSRYSPGYPGWALQEQQKLIQLVQNQHNNIPIQINESSILSPQKSQLSVIGLYQGAEEKVIEPACKNCSLLDCACLKNNH